MNPIPNFLVCNPDERVRSLFLDAFASLGSAYQLVICASLEEGLAELRTNAPTLPFSAVFLNPRDSLDSWSEIDKLRRAVPGLPILLFTDFLDAELDRFATPDCFPSGVILVQPPVNRIEIWQWVRSILEKPRPDQPDRVEKELSTVPPLTPPADPGGTTAPLESAGLTDLHPDLYRTLVEDSFDTVFIQDNGRILFANHQACQMFGYDLTDIIGMTFGDLVHPDFLSIVEERERALMNRADAVCRFDCRLLGRDRVVIEAEINAKAIRLGQRRIIQTLVRDIADRKRFEEKIIMAKQEWERTFDSVPDLIGILNKDARFVRVNRALADRMNMSPSEAIGLGCCLAYHGRSHPPDRCPFQEVYEDKRSIRTAMLLPSIGGEFEITVSPILDKTGGIVGAVHVAHDITDRQESRRELEHSLSTLTATLESTADGILVVAHNGDMQGYNQKFVQMWSIPAWMLQDKSALLVLDYISPQVENGTAYKKIITEIAQQDLYEGLSPVRLKDGRVFEQYTQPQKIGPNVVGRVWSFRDITARVKAEGALRESEEKYRFIVEKSLAGIYIIQDGRFRFGNARFYQMLGYDNPDELLNQSFWLPVHPDDRETVKDRGLRREKGEQVTSHYHFQAVKKDGSPIWLELMAEQVTFLDRPAVIGTVLDQTERKKAEDALKESERRFRDIFDNISDIIYTHDLEGRLISVNKATCQLMGYPEKEMIGIALWQSLPAHLQELFHEKYIAKLEKDGEANGITVFLTRGGQKRYIEYRSSMVYREGQAASVRGSARDVTDRIYAEQEMKNLEDQLLQSQKMEAVGTLAGGIAHDFNNILTGIVGNLDLALSKINADHSLHRYLKTAMTASERARELTRHLLTISRKTDPQKEPMDIGETIQETLSLLRQTIDRRIMLAAHLAEGLQLVQADATQMSQVLMNLCVNALDAIERDIQDQGASTVAKMKVHRIQISAENREISPRDAQAAPNLSPGPYIVISVSDNGCGMSEETAVRIFEPFFTTKPTNKGTGLGLSTVYGIIKQHQGWINVTSKPGQGSTFHIFLPAIAAMDADLKPAVVLEGIPTGRETIFLVDDEEMIREFGQEFLEDLGYQVLLAKNGEEAVQIYQNEYQRIDLTILDMVMPQLSGKEVLDYLLELTPYAKVIVSSGHFPASGPNPKEESKANVAYMAKPYHLDELAVTIRQLLDHQD